MCAKLAYEDPRIIADVLRRCCHAIGLHRSALCQHTLTMPSAHAVSYIRTTSVHQHCYKLARVAPSAAPIPCHSFCKTFGLRFDQRLVLARTGHNGVIKFLPVLMSCRWGMQLHSYQDLPAHLTRSRRYVPDVVWFIASTRHAVVLVFRGADPFFQVWLCADQRFVAAAATSCARLEVEFH